MEDFGYRKNDENDGSKSVGKKFFLICATIFSIACFIYITISAYYFVYQDKNGNVETIKSPEEPIKILEEAQNAEGAGALQINNSIYEDIFGNKKGALKPQEAKVQAAVAPAIPPKKLAENNRQLIKDSFPNKKLSEEAKSPTAAPDKDQKIVIYSDKTKKAEKTKDLLTKNESGGEAAKPATPSKKRIIRVQVAAMTARSAAEESWKKLSHLNSDLFSGLKPLIEEVDLGKKGVFYRLQIGNFYNQIEAEEFCTRYIAKTQKNRSDCIIVE